METAKSMFQLKNKSSSNHIHIFYLTAKTHTHMTRLSSKSNYFIPRKRTEYGKKIIFLHSTKSLTVPNEIKASSFNSLTN